MGKMKMNPEEFALAAINDTNVIPADGNISAGLSTYAPERNKNSNNTQTIQVKCDMVTNIVSDVCGLIKSCISAYENITVER